jgi:hypothetical protein
MDLSSSLRPVAASVSMRALRGTGGVTRAMRISPCQGAGLLTLPLHCGGLMCLCSTSKPQAPMPPLPLPCPTIVVVLSRVCRGATARVLSYKSIVKQSFWQCMIACEQPACQPAVPRSKGSRDAARTHLRRPGAASVSPAPQCHRHLDSSASLRCARSIQVSGLEQADLM